MRSEKFSIRRRSQPENRQQQEVSTQLPEDRALKHLKRFESLIEEHTKIISKLEQEDYYINGSLPGCAQQTDSLLERFRTASEDANLVEYSKYGSLQDLLELIKKTCDEITALREHAFILKRKKTLGRKRSSLNKALEELINTTKTIEKNVTQYNILTNINSVTEEELVTHLQQGAGNRDAVYELYYDEEIRKKLPIDPLLLAAVKEREGFLGSHDSLSLFAQSIGYQDMLFNDQNNDQPLSIEDRIKKVTKYLQDFPPHEVEEYEDLANKLSRVRTVPDLYEYLIQRNRDKLISWVDSTTSDDDFTDKIKEEGYKFLQQKIDEIDEIKKIKTVKTALEFLRENCIHIGDDSIGNYLEKLKNNLTHQAGKLKPIKAKELELKEDKKTKERIGMLWSIFDKLIRTPERVYSIVYDESAGSYGLKYDEEKSESGGRRQNIQLLPFYLEECKDVVTKYYKNPPQMENLTLREARNLLDKLRKYDIEIN